MRTNIEAYWRELCSVASSMPYAALERVADMLIECAERGRTIFVAGNGGSAATASHFACDLLKGSNSPEAPPLRVVPLTDNVPLITAFGNDVGYDEVFAGQLTALVRPNDVLVAISASGNSPNILAAVGAARQAEAITVGLTGECGGRLAQMCDQAVRVPLAKIEQVEDAHLIITHSLCVAIRERRAQQRRDVLVDPLLHGYKPESSVADGE